jgi:hypothetical protein
MKKLLIFLLMLVAVPLFAADDQVNGPSSEKTISLWQTLIPAIVPLIIAGLKYIIPRLPKKLTPWLAPILGALIDLLLNWANLGDGKGLVGAFLGTAGIGVRELIHNSLKKGEDGLPSVRLPITIFLAAILSTAGCATQIVDKTDPDGNHTKYQTRAIFNKTAFSNVVVDKKTAKTGLLFGVGAYGAETQGDALAQFVGSLQGLFEAGVKAGMSAAAGKPPIP